MAYYCPHCLTESKSPVGICPYCGRQLDSSNASFMLKAGSILNNRYIVGHSLGKGGFGITYLGLDTILNKRTAIKEFYLSSVVTRDSSVGNTVFIQDTADIQNVQKWKQRFYAEAQNLAKFAELPSVVTVYDYFQENNTAYIVMEYVNGVNAKEYVKQYGVLTFNQAYQLMRPVMSALQVIHSEGLIHRDIGPTNIMIQQDGTSKLMDFGTARYYGELNNKTTVVLSPGYAPLEQYQGTNKQGPWTDVYAVCATMYYLMTGSAPTNALARSGNTVMPLPSELGASIEAAQEKVLLTGLALGVHERYQSMSDLMTAFDSSMGHSKAASGRINRPKLDLFRKREKGSTATGTAPGNTGNTGGTGSRGSTGSTGIGGSTGSTGTHGSTGTTGDYGTGFHTVTVTTDITGTAGTTGISKSGGTTGIQGTTGTMGFAGQAGRGALTGNRKDKKTVILLGLVAGAAIIVLAISLLTVTGVFKPRKPVGTAQKKSDVSTSNGNQSENDLNDAADGNIVDMTPQNSINDVGDNGKTEGQSTMTKASATIVTGDTGDAPSYHENDYAVIWDDDSLEAAMREATNITDRDIMHSDVENITELRLSGWGISNISALSEMSNLSYLDLSDNVISDIEALSDLDYLEWLSLEGNAVVSIEPLSHLTRLKQLYLNDMSIKDISPISGLTNLRTLELRNNQISDISPLSQLSSLEILDLQVNQISDLKPLEGLYGITSLGLTYNNITDVIPLMNLFNLEELYLGYNRISDPYAVTLCLKLQFLDLSNNMISDLFGFYNLSELVELDLSNNSITDVSALGELVRLVYLDLSGNQITDMSPLDNLRNATIYV
ncbi:MAG: leucine-rich repeat domain-containing protein [Lachnospiraceae bacterium]|nr:leucine-rich repeat domain-containing protein [Lachnospiraceae bacterium]